MSYHLIETALVWGVVLVAALYAAARWLPARLQPVKRWRQPPAAACSSGCSGCGGRAGPCNSAVSNPADQGQAMMWPTSRHSSR